MVKKNQNTEAVILSRQFLLNKDIIYTILSKNYGKMRIFSKGGRNICSKRSSHMVTGNIVNIIFTFSNEISYLQQTNIISGFINIKNNFEKTIYVMKYFFIVSKLLPENSEDKEVYNIVLSFLRCIALCTDYENNNIFLKHINFLLFSLGYSENQNTYNSIKKIEEIINEHIPLRGII